MTHGLDPAQQTAMLAGHRSIVPLIELYFDSGTLLLAMAPFDVVGPVGTYISTGPAAYIKPASESSKDQQGVEIGMNGFDASIGELVANENYRGRIGKIVKGYIDPSTNQLIGTPRVRFVGRMKSMTCTETNDTATVAIVLEHYEIALTKAAPLRYSDADQQRLHPGDFGCQYAVRDSNKNVIWPSKAAQGG